jgi:hypothetical protein
MKRGIGTLLARIIARTGVKKSGCGSCERREEKLNRFGFRCASLVKAPFRALWKIVRSCLPWLREKRRVHGLRKVQLRSQSKATKPQPVRQANPTPKNPSGRPHGLHKVHSR